MIKKPADKVKKILIDKMLLIVSALIIGLIIFVSLTFLKKTGLKEEWIHYFFISLLYVVVFIHGANIAIGLKKIVKNTLYLIILIFFTIFPVFIGFIIFHLKILPFPKRPFTYLILGLIVIPVSVFLFDECLKLLERRKKLHERSGGNKK